MTLEPSNFYIYNIVLIGLSILFLILAYRKGFVRQLLDVVSLIASYIISGYACTTLADSIPLYTVNTSYSTVNNVSNTVINTILWFLILVFLLRLLYWILCHIFHKVGKVKVLSFINRVFGLCLGCIKVFLLLGIVTLICKLPFIKNGSAFIDSSILRVVNTALTNIGKGIVNGLIG